MNLYHYNNINLKALKEKPFKLEKDIQNLFDVGFPILGHL